MMASRGAPTRTHPPGPPASRWSKNRKIGAGIIIAALTAALTSLIAGVITKGAEGAKDLVLRPAETVTPEPFTHNVSFPGGMATACSGYLVDKPPSDVPSPLDEGEELPVEDPHQWAVSVGGVDVDTSVVRVTLQGRTGQTVVLNGLKVVSTRTKPPGSGNVYYLGEGCGAPFSPRFFDVDLDKYPATVEPVPGQNESGEIPAVDFPFKISNPEPEIFEIYATTRQHDVTWTLDLSWTSNGVSRSTKISNNGSPFRTTAGPARAKNYFAVPDNWETYSD